MKNSILKLIEEGKKQDEFTVTNGISSPVVISAPIGFTYKYAGCDRLKL
jgi:hypothetical protein